MNISALPGRRHQLFTSPQEAKELPVPRKEKTHYTPKNLPKTPTCAVIKAKGGITDSTAKTGAPEQIIAVPLQKKRLFPNIRQGERHAPVLKDLLD